jgi:hypothetical protein
MRPHLGRLPRLDDTGFFLISQCTHRAHEAIQVFEDLELSLQSIMGKFELVSGSVLGRRTIFTRVRANETAAIGANQGPATISNCYLRLWPERWTGRPIRAQYENRNASDEANRLLNRPRGMLKGALSGWRACIR